MADTDETVFTVVVRDTTVYGGNDLEAAIRTWDASTYNLGTFVPGGIEVRTWRGGLMIREGWLVHVRENGVTYISPSLKAS